MTFTFDTTSTPSTPLTDVSTTVTDIATTTPPTPSTPTTVTEPTLTAAGSGHQWTPMPSLVRQWLTTVREYGPDRARALAVEPVELAAIAQAIAIVEAERGTPR